MRIALLGDIALIGRYDREKTANVEQRLKEISSITAQCDFVVANLEAPLTQRNRTTACKGVYLRSSPCNVETLKTLHITHVTLANNHIFDYGKQGKDETIATLEKNQIGYVGLNGTPALLTSGKDRAMLDGFCCYSANGLNYGNKQGQLKVLSKDTIERFLAYAEEARCLPIVSAHFGVEGVHYPSVEHRRLFTSLSNKVPFVLHGNHPHAIQGVEDLNSSLMLYAQGNLCFDVLDTTSVKKTVIKQTSKERESYIAVIEVNGNALKSYELFGFSDDKDGFQHRSSEVELSLNEYSKAFLMAQEEYSDCRKTVCRDLRRSSNNHDIHFFLNRLNIRYIVAYINGILHARKYRNIFSNFFDKEQSL